MKIQSMIANASVRVKSEGFTSNLLDCPFGVSQGSMLSPKRFTEFLTDIDLYLPKSNGVSLNQNLMSLLLYADDLVIF